MSRICAARQQPPLASGQIEGVRAIDGATEGSDGDLSEGGTRAPTARVAPTP